jgi:hypothetical protein
MSREKSLEGEKRFNDEGHRKSMGEKKIEVRHL